MDNLVALGIILMGVGMVVVTLFALNEHAEKRQWMYRYKSVRDDYDDLLKAHTHAGTPLTFYGKTIEQWHALDKAKEGEA